MLKRNRALLIIHDFVLLALDTNKVHVHSRTRVPLATKFRICLEALGPYSPGSIRCTARNYQVGPSQIRRWQKLLKTLTQDENDECLSSKMFRRSDASRKFVLKPAFIAHLKSYYDRMRDKSKSIDIWMLMLEAKRFDPVSTSFLLYFTFRSCIRCGLCHRKWGLLLRRAMKKAQSTRTCECCLIADFKKMVQENIKMYNIPLSNIYNTDQTKCYYSFV